MQTENEALELNNNLEDKKLVFNTIGKFPTISQWFCSLEGEGNNIGEPSLYVRLAGCYSASCTWCDSKYSWFVADGKDKLYDLTDQVREELSGKDIKRMTITGGEPLHFIEYIPDIFNWAQELEDNSLDYLGIESNGNLLAQEDIAVKTMKTFNSIRKTLKISPMLTISPKIDSLECYGGSLNNEEIIEMYTNVINNCTEYLTHYDINFKFVYKEDADNENLFKLIQLVKDHGFENRKILVMPWTPEDPLGNDKEIWESSKDNASRMALKHGLKYSPRIHVDRRLD